MLDRFMQHDAQDGCTFHSYLFSHNDGCLHVPDDGVHTKRIARDITFGQVLDEIAFQFAAIILLDGVARKSDELLI